MMTSSVPKRTNLTRPDTASGLAVMGILLINSISFFIDGLAVYQINRPESQSRLDWWIAAFGEVFVDQKFMGLFSLLFGASFLLFLERVQDRTKATRDARPLAKCPTTRNRDISPWRPVAGRHPVCVRHLRALLFLFRHASAAVPVLDGSFVLLRFTVFSF